MDELEEGDLPIEDTDAPEWVLISQVMIPEEVGHLHCARDCALDSIRFRKCNCMFYIPTSTASFPCQFGLGPRVNVSTRCRWLKAATKDISTLFPRLWPPSPASLPFCSYTQPYSQNDPGVERPHKFAYARMSHDGVQPPLWLFCAWGQWHGDRGQTWKEWQNTYSTLQLTLQQPEL